MHAHVHVNLTQDISEVNLPLLNKTKAALKQKRGRDKWIEYVSSFMSHRNLMIGKKSLNACSLLVFSTYKNISNYLT